MIPKLIFLCALVVTQAAQIHHHMTANEIQSVFGSSKVPDYEVVPIVHTLHKRDADEEQVVKLDAFERKIELYLNPTEGIFFGPHTPVYTVTPNRFAPRGLQYKKVNDVFTKAGRPYQDIFTNSAVVLNKMIDGSVQMVGKVLNDYVIQPIPQRLGNFFRFRRSINETDGDFSQSHHHHIIFRKPELSYDDVHQGMRLIERERAHRNDLHTGRSKRSIPDVIYPEALVVMDYSLYKTQNENLKTALTYLLSFWNAVDLRYRTMSEPRIRLNIAGCIISIKEGGTPYIDSNKRGDAEVDADKALYQMSSDFYNEYRFPFNTYDFAVAMTQLDMCNMMGNSVCDRSTLGFAFEAGACNRSAIDRNTEAVGMVEDNGGYSGIIPATHEVAHLLGVPHDGIDSAMDCPGYEGFIMTHALNLGENNFYWSKCSVRAFQEFFNSPDGTCLFNHPPQDSQLPKLLPGKLRSLDEQCEKVYGTRACKYDETVCTRLECYYPQAGNCRALAAAAEGSYCGENMHCLNGHCLSVNATTLAEPPSFAAQQFHPIIPKWNPSGWESPFDEDNEDSNE